MFTRKDKQCSFLNGQKAQTRQFTEEKMLTFKHMKRCSILFITRIIKESCNKILCFTYQVIDKDKKVLYIVWARLWAQACWYIGSGRAIWCISKLKVHSL